MSGCAFPEASAFDIAVEYAAAAAANFPAAADWPFILWYLSGFGLPQSLRCVSITLSRHNMYELR